MRYECVQTGVSECSFHLFAFWNVHTGCRSSLMNQLHESNMYQQGCYFYWYTFYFGCFSLFLTNSLKQANYEKKLKDLLAVATVVDHSKSPCESNFIPDGKVSRFYGYSRTVSYFTERSKHTTNNMAFIAKKNIRYTLNTLVAVIDSIPFWKVPYRRRSTTPWVSQKHEFSCKNYANT